MLKQWVSRIDLAASMILMTAGLYLAYIGTYVASPDVIPVFGYGGDFITGIVGLVISFVGLVCVFDWWCNVRQFVIVWDEDQVRRAIVKLRQDNSTFLTSENFGIEMFARLPNDINKPVDNF